VRRPGQQQQQQQQQQRPGGGPAPPQYAPVGVSGLAEAGYGEQARVIQDETQLQNANLDQIAAGLEHLKHGALAMQVRARRGGGFYG
jgi:hypothetical protein